MLTALLVLLVLAVLLNYGAFGARWRGVVIGLIYGIAREWRGAGTFPGTG